MNVTLRLESEPEIVQAVEGMLAHAKAQGETLSKSQAVIRLVKRGIQAASRPHPRKAEVAAPTPDEVQAFCIEEGLKPYTRGLGLVMDLREGCLNWKEQVRDLYKPPKPRPMTVQFHQ